MNWDAYLEVAPGKHATWVIKHESKPSIYNDVLYTSRDEVLKMIEFEGIKNAIPYRIVYSRPFKNKTEKKGVKFTDD